MPKSRALTAHQVQAIRQQRKAGNTILAIAETYSRDIRTISDLLAGRTYTHVTDDPLPPELAGHAKREKARQRERERQAREREQKERDDRDRERERERADLEQKAREKKERADLEQKAREKKEQADRERKAKEQKARQEKARSQPDRFRPYGNNRG